MPFFDTFYLQISVLAFNLVRVSSAFFEREFDTRSPLFIAASFPFCPYRRLRRIKILSLVSLVITTFYLLFYLLLHFFYYLFMNYFILFVLFILHLIIGLIIGIPRASEFCLKIFIYCICAGLPV